MSKLNYGEDADGTEGSHLNPGVYNASTSFLSIASAFSTDDVVARTRVEVQARGPQTEGSLGQ